MNEREKEAKDGRTILFAALFQIIQRQHVFAAIAQFPEIGIVRFGVLRREEDGALQRAALVHDRLHFGDQFGRRHYRCRFGLVDRVLDRFLAQSCVHSDD